MIHRHRLPAHFGLLVLILVTTSLACQVAGLRISQDNPDDNPQTQTQKQPQVQEPDRNQNPNPVNPAQNTATFKITGIWESQVQTEYGMVATRLLLEPTGTFSQTVNWNNLMTYDTGEYNIIQNAIHFTVTHHEPTEYLGRQLTWATSFTYFVTPINATSMTVEDRVMNTSWTMQRTGP